MLRMKTILVPVDLSVPSMLVVQYAGVLAGSFDASVTLLYAGATGDELSQRLQALARTEFGPLCLSTVVLKGDPARVIVDYARSEGVGLIVMSTHGYGPFRRLLLGSVTTKVLDATDCPVLTGTHMEHAAAGYGARFDNIVCAVDLGSKTEEVARWAGDFAAAVGGRLFLLHIVPSLGAEEGDYFRADANLARVEQVSEELTALRDTLGVSAKVIVAGGGVPDAISRQAAELGANVLVAGRGTCAGRLGRLRSNAYAIIRSTPCPVITV